MSIWDDPDMKVSDNFVKFEAVGDTVTGTIVNIRAHRWDNGDVSPQILLDCDGDERTVTAGQVRLKAALAEKRPEAGDVITITLSDIEKRPGGKTLKHFDVSVVPAGQARAKPAAAPAQQLPEGLTEEQKAALSAIGFGK